MRETKFLRIIEYKTALNKHYYSY